MNIPSRYKRQPTFRVFASEFSNSSLTAQDSEEYAPAFVISKIGAKINRALVCGVLENLERREGDSGSSYNFTVRDPTGIIRLNIAPFQPELHPIAEEMLSKFDSGERFLAMFVGKSRWYESEDGGLFTSLRVEEFCEINKQRYQNWLLNTAESTLNRIAAYEKSLEVGLDENEMRNYGITEEMIPGIYSARNHYQNVDTEDFRLGVLKAISMVTKGTDPIQKENNLDESIVDSKLPPKVDGENASQRIESADPEQVIIDLLTNSGGLLEYDVLVEACISAGNSAENAEDAIENLRDVRNKISEPRFGFFSISS